MKLGFLTRSPLFRAKLTAGMPAPYMFDVLSLFFVLAVFLGFDALKGFRHRDAVVMVTTSAFALIGSIGIYGVRLALWIAILRKNRMPQTLEWLVCLIPLACTILCFIFSGPMVRAYAAGQGYHRCADKQDHGTLYVYAAPSAACPVQPPGSIRS